MTPIQFVLADDSQITLNAQNDPVVERYLSRPKAFAQEMVNQINQRNHYYRVFSTKKQGLFLDIGANLGIVSIFVSPLFQRIIAVEAEPNTCEVMRRLCSPFGHIHCVNAALSSKTGPVSLSVDERNWTCHTTTNPLPQNPTKRVPGFSFLDLLDACGISQVVDFCKVDVEGAEMDSLTEDVLTKAPVNQWCIEVHHTPKLTIQQSAEIMKSRLQKIGFTTRSPRANTIITSRA